MYKYCKTFDFYNFTINNGDCSVNNQKNMYLLIKLEEDKVGVSCNCCTSKFILF